MTISDPIKKSLVEKDHLRKRYEDIDRLIDQDIKERGTVSIELLNQSYYAYADYLSGEIQHQRAKSYLLDRIKRFFETKLLSRTEDS